MHWELGIKLDNLFAKDTRRLNFVHCCDKDLSVAKSLSKMYAKNQQSAFISFGNLSNLTL